MAKERAKKGRMHEDAFKVLAQAQEVMSKRGLQCLRGLDTQTFMNILTLPTEHLDVEARDFLRVWKLNEMAKLKARISPMTSPMPPTAARSTQTTVLSSDED